MLNLETTSNIVAIWDNIVTFFSAIVNSDIGSRIYNVLCDVFTFIFKFIPLTALLGIFTRIVIDLRERRATIRSSIFSFFGSSILVYIVSPLLAKYITSYEMFGFCSFLLGLLAMKIINWIEEQDRVKKWLDLIEQVVIDFFKSKFKKK